ncbi:probable xyloglucan endotransglucosylase/hydrolase protein 26 [Oryza brachyantha]|uniref:probable xyloglucan endotransglucosylase/hydrolase protein 26 n=1 Tax=Oryza brachyantha TaxID=4533 RepID=UPI001ADC1DE7|nr:probable xyloglucan endotransglucosylase/hydrolase protein 26 [Oryza brachyantha]
MAKAVVTAAVVAVAVAAVLELGLVGANFQDQCDITWEPQNAKMTEGGNHLTLSLVSNSSGCMLRTKKQFIYGSVSTRIQLVKGNSAGTVTTYYTSSIGEKHDEIDFEFLGNETGKPYTLHTNVFADGVGSREMQFRPWFDPTDGFHNYTIFWNPCMIVWFVDSIPIRVFRNHSEAGVAFPTQRPMYAFSSIWAAEDWATQGGRVKTDWTKAPFVAEYRDIALSVCECSGSGSAAGAGADAASPTCARGCATPDHWYAAPELCQLSEKQLRQMKAVQLGYTIYDYCADARAKGRPVPPECALKQY